MLLPGRIYFGLGPWHFGDFLNIFLPNIGEDQKKSYDFSSEPLAGTQARSQKFAMGEGCFGGLVAGPPVTGGQWGLGGEAPAARGWGCGGGAFSARKFCNFLQNELNFRAILIVNNAFKTWHKNWQPIMIQLAALMGYMGSG